MKQNLSNFDRSNTRPLVSKAEPRELKVLKSEQIYDTKIERMRIEDNYCTFDPVKEFSHYKVSDFSLDNIVAVGALNKLQTVSVDGDRLNMIDSVNTQELDKQLNE